MNSRYETGSVLILVLLFMMAGVLLVSGLIQQNLIIRKTYGSFREQFLHHVKAETELWQVENEIKSNPLENRDKKIGFVPDHLAFGCGEGLQIFKITKKPYQKIIGLRSPEFPLENKQLIGSCLLSLPSMSITNLSSPDTELLEVVHVKQTSHLYSLVDEGASQNGVLYQKDLSGNLLARLNINFPVKKGFLVVKQIVLGNTRKTILVLTAEGHDETQNLISVYDITEASSPFANVLFTRLSTHRIGVRPLFIRLGTREGIVLGGELGHRNSIQILFLDNYEFSSPWIFEDVFKFLTAVDQHGKGVVDRLYALNTTGLWGVDLSNSIQVPFKKIFSVIGHSVPLVLKDSEGQGFRIYFLGKEGPENVVYEIHDDLTERPAQGRVIQRGNFVDIFARFNRLVLVLRNALEPPVVLTLPIQGSDLNRHVLPLSWENTMTEGIHLREVTSSKLIREGVEDKDVLFILNNSCQLSTYKGRLHENPYPLSWRKLFIK